MITPADSERLTDTWKNLRLALGDLRELGLPFETYLLGVLLLALEGRFLQNGLEAA